MIAQLLRDLAAGLPPAEVYSRYPELNSEEGQSALQRAAYLLDESRKDTWMLSELFEHIPELVFVKEAETLTYVRFNGVAQQLMGMRAEDSLGKSDYDLFSAEEAADFQDLDRKVLREGRMVEVAEQPVMTPLGPKIFHTKKLPILDLDGTPRFLVGISRDITPMVRAREELARGQEQHRRLSAALQQAQENERSRLAEELNEELGQVLTGLKIELAWMEERADSPATLPEHFTRSQKLINSALATVRRVATALHPQMLEQLGLQPALDWLAEDLSGRAQRPVTVDYQLNQAPSPELAITIFRVCQEALTHNLRHNSNSNQVALALTLSDELHGSEVTISLDGSLASSEADELGLVGLRERVHLWGGTLWVQGGEPDRLGGWRVRLPLLPS